MHEVSSTEEIEQIKMERPHVVLLGAGASRAAFPSGDAFARRLPLMKDFYEIVPIAEILDGAGINHKGKNFEEIYSDISESETLSEIKNDLELCVFDYFSSLKMPDIPTIYDHLILSLRKKDVIATFNWDPFLIQAIRRNRIQKEFLPTILFLHGNVMAGFCQKDKVHGVRGGICPKCKMEFEPSRLLFPVKSKPYNEFPEISDAWRYLELAFKSAFMITIFGYGAPISDESAIRLLERAWGSSEDRHMEQFEIVDIRPHDELLNSWERFIHSHHYGIHDDIYDSWLFNHPRRTGEAYINQYLEAKFIENNPIPQNVTFPELWDWVSSLMSREHPSLH